MSVDYLDWALRQKAYSDKLKSAIPVILSHWGDYSYNVSIPGRDSSGHRRIFRFQVENLFCESFSIAKGLEYDFYPRPKENASKIAELYAGKRHYVSCVFDKIAAYILSLPERPVVLLADQPTADWKSKVDFHFAYLLDVLDDLGIKCLDWSDINELDTIQPNYIVIVELVSNIDRLKYNCEQVLKSSAISMPVLTYFSLLKEYDRLEMAELIEASKRSKEESTATEPSAVEAKSSPESESEYSKMVAAIQSRKKDAESIARKLSDNGIRYFYHFTDRRNLDSIKKHRGLYSWRYCDTHGITIPFPGGNSDSRRNDMRHNIQDYVRLSFCEDHPMSWRLQQSGYDLVLLKIKAEVALAEGTMFSDINAASSAHHHGGSLTDFNRVDLPATQARCVRSDSPIFHKHQAEVLVKTFLPIEYIVNIDNPDLV